MPTTMNDAVRGTCGRPAQCVGAGGPRATHPQEIHEHVVAAVSERHGAISTPSDRGFDHHQQPRCGHAVQDWFVFCAAVLPRLLKSP